MTLERYSLYAFEPQYQSYHLLHDVDFHLNRFDISVFPEHLQRFILESHNQRVELYKENYADFQYGVWAFIEGCKNNESLNHLNQRVPCWKAEISDNTIVYDVNWTEKFSITNDVCKDFGFYIPASQLSTLTNVRRRRITA